MSNFENEILIELNEIQDVIEAIIMEEDDFTLVSNIGETRTVDREHFLQFGLDAVTNMLQSVISDIENRKEKKSKFKIIK